jgi:hypothetical protein
LAKSADEVDPISGEKKCAPTTLRGWYSTIKMFSRHKNQGDLDKELPIINTKLDHWEKEYVTKKAKVFSKTDLRK